MAFKQQPSPCPASLSPTSILWKWSWDLLCRTVCPRWGFLSREYQSRATISLQKEEMFQFLICPRSLLQKTVKAESSRAPFSKKPTFIGQKLHSMCDRLGYWVPVMPAPARWYGASSTPGETMERTRKSLLTQHPPHGSMWNSKKHSSTSAPVQGCWGFAGGKGSHDDYKLCRTAWKEWLFAKQ